MILLVTDITGHTDVFTFVEKGHSQKIDRKDAAIETTSGKKTNPDLEKVETMPVRNMVIYFEQNSNELSGRAIVKLNEVFDTMLKNPDAKPAIYGFPHSEGSPSYNKMLSENRVYKVKMYLVGKGLNPQRTKTVIDSVQVNSPLNGVAIKIEIHAGREN